MALYAFDVAESASLKLLVFKGTNAETAYLLCRYCGLRIK